MQCNTPTDNYRFNFDSERPLVQPEFTSPFEEVSLRCEALVADVENVDATKNEYVYGQHSSGLYDPNSYS
nr:hypothetical protein [Tanacetum cinerariifolium]